MGRRRKEQSEARQPEVKQPEVKQYHKENPKLMTRTCQDGSMVYYLEYYRGRVEENRLDADGNQMYYSSGKMAGKPMYCIKHIRTKETLPWHIRPDMCKEERDAITRLAKEIRAQREYDYLQSKTGYRPKFNRSTNFIDWCTDYVASETADHKVMVSVLGRFKKFLQTDFPSYYGEGKGIDGADAYFLMADGLNSDLVGKFFKHLQDTSKGNGAASAFRRFKKMCGKAVKADVLQTNPCDEVKVVSSDETTKEILSVGEIGRLIQTHYTGENPEIRKAFIFSLYTGCRFCDVNEMRYSNIDYQNKTLAFLQQKVKHSSKHSKVTMPLLETLLDMVGTPESNGKQRDEKIFNLPSDTMCLKALRSWTKKAGIEKHITWHCARHTFATLLADGAINENTIAEMLGHSSLEMTKKYTRATNKAKQDAMQGIGLPEITE